MRRMQWIVAVVAMVAWMTGMVLADSPVAPPDCTFTNFRGEGVSYVSPETFYKGQALLFTNCVLYSGSSTSSAVQGLTNVTVALTIGTTLTNNIYYAITNAANSTWSYQFTSFPTNWDDPTIQIKVTDSSGNIYTYPWKKIHLSTAL